MERSKVTKDKRDINKRKSIVMSIRVSKDMSDYMKKNNFAPSLIFYEALKELGFVEQQNI